MQSRSVWTATFTRLAVLSCICPLFALSLWEDPDPEVDLKTSLEEAFEVASRQRVAITWLGLGNWWQAPRISTLHRHYDWTDSVLFPKSGFSWRQEMMWVSGIIQMVHHMYLMTDKTFQGWSSLIFNNRLRHWTPPMMARSAAWFQLKVWLTSDAVFFEGFTIIELRIPPN